MIIIFYSCYDNFLDVYLCTYKEMKEKPSLSTLRVDIARHEVWPKSRSGWELGLRSNIHYAVNSVGLNEEKPRHKEAMNSFLAKLSL